ncbi:MAG TPA: caspase family protein [Pyrinomonadaceae bacterium]
MNQLVSMLIVFFVLSSSLPLTTRHAHANRLSPPKAGASNTPGHKRALLVGIDKYNRGSKEPYFDWWDLNTSNDIAILKQELIRKFQFDEKDILVLDTKERTTHKAIVDAFRDFLIKPTTKGDVVFFHYSGHGQQIPDDNGDEIDGYDESLIPSDYVSQKDGSKNIRDDEIGVLLDELKAKEPSNVTISLDSCFSGTATRGQTDLQTRGGPWRGTPVAKTQSRGQDNSPSGLLERGQQPPAGYVFLAAASQEQTAKEVYNDDNKPMGLYTYALVKALDESGPNTTYRDLFERLNDIMTRRRNDQNPQLEGQLDKVLMEGTALPPQRYISVKVEPRRSGGDAVVLQAGKLQGMSEGSRFALYPAGTKDPQQGEKLADAVISTLSLTIATLTVEGKPDAEKLRTARAFETEHRYDDKLLKVITRGLDKLTGGPDAVAQIKSSELLATETPGSRDWNVLIRAATPEDVTNGRVSAGFHGAVLERDDGSILATAAEGDTMGKAIKEALEGEIRWVTVKSLENTDPNLQIEMRLIPVNVELNDQGYVTKVLGDKSEGLRRTSGNQVEMRVGDHVMIELKNSSSEDLYITVLNLRSDAKVGPGWPQQIPNVPAQDNKLKAGQVLRIPEPYVFRIEEPLGQESFRAIATRTPTDFTPLIDADLLKRGEPTSERGGNAARSPLGRMLKAAQTGKRSGINMAVPPSWATATVTYTIRQGSGK